MEDSTPILVPFFSVVIAASVVWLLVRIVNREWWAITLGAIIASMGVVVVCWMTATGNLFALLGL